MNKTNLCKVSIEVLKRELSISTNALIQGILEDLIVEYEATGTISEETASYLIGTRPKMITSRDTAYTDIWAITTKEYEAKFKVLKEHVANLVAEINAEIEGEKE